jgi:NADH-quinone oxidoreductase subunit F
MRKFGGAEFINGRLKLGDYGARFGNTMAIQYKTGKEPHPLEHRMIFKNVDRVDWDTSIDRYLKEGGYDMLKKALKMDPKAITEEVKKSGLRGRGGAGFPTGVKWGFLPPNNTKPVYLICNADESEPGTFKDRYIMHQDPHQLIEGMAISCFAVGAKLSYIYIREEFPEAAKILERAIAEAHAKGFLGKNVLGSGVEIEIYVHRGAGAYICGEETGLIESLEGKRPYPRIKPPFFPAALGLYMCPTIVNNVESLCHVKHILEMGGENYAKLGRPNNTGTRILCVSGDVQKPGYYEIQVGTVTMRQVIEDLCGGLKPGRSLKAIIPGGSSAKVLRADEVFKIKQADGTEQQLTVWDIPMDFDTIAKCGSMAGSGGVIIMDDTRDMAWVINNLNAFYAHESCGQCTPCREGSLWMRKITDRLVAGQASPDDVALLESVAYQIDGRTICAFGEACSWPTESFVAKFRDELLARTREENRGKDHSPVSKLAMAGLAS